MIGALIDAWNGVAEATGITRVPDRLYHPQETGVETLRMPAYCQTQSYTCGPIAALMVVHFFKPDYPSDGVFRQAGAEPDGGTGVGRLVQTLRGCGIKVGQRTELEFDDLVRAIDKGSPVVTCVHTDDPDITHWVVIYGYGIRPNRIYMAPNGLPFFSRKEYPWGLFKQHFWTDTGFGLVCSNRAGK